MKVLWVKTDLLHPLDSGGALRTFHMLRCLKRTHNITYLTPATRNSPTAANQAHEYCDRLIMVPGKPVPTRRSPAFYWQAVVNLRSEYPLALERYAMPALQARLATLVREEKFDVAVSDFLSPALHFDGVKSIPKVLFQHNVETLIWQRMAERAGLLGRAYFSSQARRMRHWEGALAHQFDHVVTVSPDDERLMRDWFGVDPVTAISTGVDPDFYHPGPPPRGQYVVFVGSLDWLPNIDGVYWLLDSIWPLIRRDCPNAKLHIVGRRPGTRLRRRLEHRSDVRLWADVADVRDHLWAAAVVVVPLRVGGGTRLKILEALACAKAVVSTAVGAEGLGVTPNEHLVIGSSPEEFARAVVDLLQDENRREQLAESGRKVVVEKHSWQRAAAEFAEALENPAT